MLIGVMNNPDKDLIKEIKWIGKNKFDFIDLTLEPTEAYPKKVNVTQIKKLILQYGLKVIGHTPPISFIASELPIVRNAAVAEMTICLKVFKKIGVKKVAVHYFQPTENFIKSLKKIAKEAKRLSIKIMVENVQGSIKDYKKVFSQVKGIKFHLDIAHANFWRDTVKLFLKNFAKKLEHVHISDNNKRDDLHLPLGAGSIDWKKAIRLLKKYGYNNTITLEIFSLDKDYLLISRDKLEKEWSKC